MSTVAGKLAALLAPQLGGELPVRIRAWNGSEAGPSDAPVLQLTGCRAVRPFPTGELRMPVTPDWVATG